MKKEQGSSNENAGKHTQRSVSAPAVITSCFIVCTIQYLKHIFLLDRINIILANRLSHFKAIYTHPAGP